MSPTGSLELLECEDGDIIITVREHRDDGLIGPGEAVEFCHSGGRSPQTLHALRHLASAMQSDANYDAARGRRPQPVTIIDEPFPHDDPPWSERRQKALQAAIAKTRCPRCNSSNGDPCVTVRGRHPGRDAPQWHSPRVKRAHDNLEAARDA